MNNDSINQENNVLNEGSENQVLQSENEVNKIEETSQESLSTDEIVSENEIFNLKDFNTINTLQGEVNFNEQMYIELKTTNVYLNLILIATVTCFLYYVISKALKKLFYVNI